MRTAARRKKASARQPTNGSTRRDGTPFVAAAPAQFAISNYPAGVKGAYPRVGIFCGRFPFFFMPQKTQKNPANHRKVGGCVQRIYSSRVLDT
jgi:hypothetical protein